MEPMDKTAAMLAPIISAAGANMTINEGDYLDDEGLYVCGKCGKRKQTVIMIPDRRVVHCTCDCDIKRMEDEKNEFRRKEEERLLKRLKEASMMDAEFEDCTFDKFERDEWNEYNLKLCNRYATGFDDMLSKNQGLLMYGSWGTGKSFAAACIANYLLEHKVPVIMVSMPRLIEMISSNRGGESEIISRLNHAKLVIFDDLGAERETAYAAEKVYTIIDNRCRIKLPMIVTTNFTIEEIKNCTDPKYARVFSRISKYCHPMNFVGPDRRKVEAGKRFDETRRKLGES